MADGTDAPIEAPAGAPAAAAAPAAAPAGAPAGTSLTDDSAPAPSSAPAGQGEGAAAPGQGTGGEEAPAGAAPDGGEGASEGEGGEAQGAPEQYADFTLPEGYELSGDMLEGVTTFARSHKLTQEQAQAIVDLGAKQADAITSQFVTDATTNPVVMPEHWAKQWSEQTAADPILGGENLTGTMALATRVFKTFASPELGEFLNQSGLGHHPELVRFMHKVGTMISEDVLVKPAGGPGGQEANTTKAKTLYPNMN